MKGWTSMHPFMSKVNQTTLSIWNLWICFSPSLDNFHTVGGKAETKGGGLGRSHTPSASTTHLGHDCPPPANRKGPPGDRQAEARRTSQPCTKGYRGAQAKDPFEKKQLCHMDVVHVICLWGCKPRWQAIRGDDSWHHLRIIKVKKTMPVPRTSLHNAKSILHHWHD
jgi:hypothetical protein